MERGFGVACRPGGCPTRHFAHPGRSGGRRGVSRCCRRFLRLGRHGPPASPNSPTAGRLCEPALPSGRRCEAQRQVHDGLRRVGGTQGGPKVVWHFRAAAGHVAACRRVEEQRGQPLRTCRKPVGHLGGPPCGCTRGGPKPEFLDFQEIVSPPKCHGLACIGPSGFPGQFPRVRQTDVLTESQGRVHAGRLRKGGARRAQRQCQAGHDGSKDGGGRHVHQKYFGGGSPWFVGAAGSAPWSRISPSSPCTRFNFYVNYK